jgi:hypothetical protein
MASGYNTAVVYPITPVVACVCVHIAYLFANYLCISVRQAAKNAATTKKVVLVFPPTFNSITNAINSLPSLLTINYTDSHVHRLLKTLRADLPVCQTTVQLGFLQLEQFPIKLIQPNYLSSQA